MCVASGRCTTVPVVPLVAKKKLTPVFFTVLRLLCPGFSFADVDRAMTLPLSIGVESRDTETECCCFFLADPCLC